MFEDIIESCKKAEKKERKTGKIYRMRDGTQMEVGHGGLVFICELNKISFFKADYSDSFIDKIIREILGDKND